MRPWDTNTEEEEEEKNNKMNPGGGVLLELVLYHVPARSLIRAAQVNTEWYWLCRSDRIWAPIRNRLLARWPALSECFRGKGEIWRTFVTVLWKAPLYTVPGAYISGSLGEAGCTVTWLSQQVYRVEFGGGGGGRTIQISFWDRPPQRWLTPPEKELRKISGISRRLRSRWAKSPPTTAYVTIRFPDRPWEPVHMPTSKFSKHYWQLVSGQTTTTTTTLSKGCLGF